MDLLKDQRLKRTQRGLSVLRSFFFFSALIFSLCHFAAAAPVLKVVSPPKKASVGESFTFQVKLEWPRTEGPYEVRSDNPLFESLELLHQGQSEETDSSGAQAVITLELRASKAGEGRILPFEIHYRKTAAGTEPWQNLPVPGQRILITRPFPWQPVIIVLSTVLASLLTVRGLVTFGRSRRKARLRENAAPPDPKQRVYAHAEETITTYKGEDQRDTIDHWAREVKQVIVIYYDIPRKTATESEILEALKAKSLPAEEFSAVERLFREIEQLKFAPRNLPVREMETLQKTLLQYVRGKIIIENSPR